MKKKSILISAAVVVAALAAGFIIYQSQTNSPQRVFDRYMKTTLVRKTLAANESYAGTGSTTVATGSIDTTKKSYTIKADLKCTAQFNNAPVSLDSTVQVQNAIGYVKINTVSGNITGSNGTKVDLQPLFAKTTSNWYSTPEDKAQKAQVDSGVYAFDNGVTAPSYDAEKAIKVFNDKKVFTYNRQSWNGLAHRFKVTTNKNAYLAAIKELYPNLSNPDLIIDSIFDKKDSRESIIEVNSDGKLLKQELSQSNLCKELLESILGDEVKDTPVEISGTSTPVEFSSIKIVPVTNSKPISDLGNDLTR